MDFFFFFFLRWMAAQTATKLKNSVAPESRQVSLCNLRSGIFGEREKTNASLQIITHCSVSMGLSGVQETRYNQLRNPSNSYSYSFEDPCALRFCSPTKSVCFI